MIDVYSRDAIIILNSVLDEDRKTSSFFTLVDYVKNDKRKKSYLRRLKKIKSDLNEIVRARGNHIAHFNTKLNIYENGHFPINRPIEFDPRYIKKIKKRLEIFFWAIKEELSIEGIFAFHMGEPISRSFARLASGFIKNKE